MVTIEQRAAKMDRLQGVGICEPVRFYGKSTDTKPADAPNGSSFKEIDTAKEFLFDAEGKEWYDQSPSTPDSDGEQEPGDD